MRILIVFSHPAPYKVKLFNELSKNIELDVIFERRNKNRSNKFYQEGNYLFNEIKVKGVKLGNENFFSFSIKKFIKNNYKKYDKIIMNGYSSFAEIFAINYMIKHKIPYILMVNGGIIRKNFILKKLLKKRLISHANSFLCPIGCSKNYLTHYGANENKIYTYHYSNLSLNDFVLEPISKKDKIQKRKMYNLPHNTLFVSVGQFIERKNFKQLIYLFKNTNNSLLIIGEGKQKDEYKKLIIDEGINNVVIMDFKKQNELFDILKCCDFYISLSKEDIFGHTILEALANNLPVIASNKIVSAKDVITKANGVIIDIDNEEKIQSSIKEINKTQWNLVSTSIKDYTIENSSKEIIRAIKK